MEHIMTRKEDFTDVRFGRWRVLNFDCNKPSARWWCQCDCGEVRSVSIYSLKKGLSKSCGCLKREITSTCKSIHGMTESKEYKAWESLKYRCTNTTSNSFERYGGRGIQVSDNISDSFSYFLNEVGEIPKEGKWTIDRIDYTKGYCEGNLRWATYEQQARNRGKFKNNTSGFTGVSEREGYFVAFWTEKIDEISKRKSKSFSIRKFGYNKAKELAIEYREQQIVRLNIIGYGYSENHGK